MSTFFYKTRIRRLIARQKRRGPAGLTSQELARKIGVEPSYLSRFLSNSDIHFSDELLYQLLSAIGLSWEEMDMIFLLKEYDRSTLPDRKAFLLTRIRLARVRRWKKTLSEMRAELNSLMKLLETGSGS